MPSRTGGKFLAQPGLLLLLVLAFLGGSVLPHGAASSPDITQQPKSVDHTAGGTGHNGSTGSKKAFPVLSLDYPHIQTPFEISLWVLLASLMKLGEWPTTSHTQGTPGMFSLSVSVFPTSSSSQVMLS